MISSTSKTCWAPWWTSTSRSRSSSWSSWWNNFFLSCYTSFCSVFDQFLMGNWLQIISSTYLRDMLDTMVGVDVRDKESSSSSWWNYFLSCSTLFRSSFWQEISWKWFYVLRVMLDTMVDVDIKDKEESHKKLTIKLLGMCTSLINF